MPDSVPLHSPGTCSLSPLEAFSAFPTDPCPPSIYCPIYCLYG